MDKVWSQMHEMKYEFGILTWLKNDIEVEWYSVKFINGNRIVIELNTTTIQVWT